MTENGRYHIRVFLTALFPLAVSVLFAADSFGLVSSTDSVHTDMDALELMSQRMGQNTDRFNQDYIYTGKDMDKGLRAAPAPVAADAKAAPVPVAEYTAKAAVYKAAARTGVPALTVSPAALQDAASAAASRAAAAGTASVEKPAPSAKTSKTSVLQKVGNWFSDAYSAVKSGISRALTWVHDSLVGSKRALTEEEIEAVKQAYGGKVDCSKIRVVDGSKQGLLGKILTWSGTAVTWGNTIYFPKDSDGKSQYSFAGKSYWLVHESTHVYQYQTGGWKYAVKSAWGQIRHGDSFYEYQLEAGKSFKDYNVEQQAELVEHYYQIQNGQRSATAEEYAIYQQIMAGEGLFQNGSK